VVADRRREELLRAALEVIAERGLPETRIADVAERAGTSPALVIYYFATKETLLTDALRCAERDRYDGATDRIGATESAIVRIEELVTTTCGSDTRRAAWRTARLDLWACAVRHPEVAQVRRTSDARWRETIVDIVHQGQATGLFDPVDAEQFSLSLAAVLDGLVVQLALGDPEVDADRAVRVAMRFAASTLGFKWKPKKPPRVGGKAKKHKK
jgi:AcrR family transcriptional regulator